ncbi:hypothetical protein SUDANB171_02823 [Streptomyces sp. enrichment culture]|jgi:hypothetical protein|uniref:DUF5324 family protein n=1 Tax=Streptomyces xiamenensis TaxID=408015 RepID=UPI0036E8C673
MTHKQGVRSVREQAACYARGAGAYLAPHAQRAACAARDGMRQGFSQARQNLPEGMDAAAVRAAERARVAAIRTREVAGPRIEAAMAAAGPASHEAAERSTAALAALRGQVTPQEIQQVLHRRRCVARRRRNLRRLGVAGVVVGVTVMAWRLWQNQSSPDWLMEPTPATEADAADSPRDPDVLGEDSAPRP